MTENSSAENLFLFVIRFSCVSNPLDQSIKMASFSPKTILVCVTILFLLSLAPQSEAKLNSYYYSQTCPQAEKIILETVYNASIHDPKVPARILRMFFHDCFIRVGQQSLHKFVQSHNNLYVCVANGLLLLCYLGVRCVCVTRLDRREPGGERWASKHLARSILCCRRREKQARSGLSRHCFLR